LSGGKHPFGDDQSEQAIRTINKENICLPMGAMEEHLKKPYCDDLTVLELIQSMLEVESFKRPSAEEVLDNFFFEGINVVATSNGYYILSLLHIYTNILFVKII